MLTGVRITDRFFDEGPPMIRLAATCFALLGFFCSASLAADRESHLERAREILREVPLIDGHNDTPWQYRSRANSRLDGIDLAGGTTDLMPEMHTDIPRLREGMVGGQFWSVFIPAGIGGYKPGDARVQMEQIDLTRRLVAANPNVFEMADTADDVLRIHASGKIACMMGMEGGHSIELSLPVLRMTYELGVRYMTLAHSKTIPWADSGTDEEIHGGLTEFGKEVVREMNRLGMLIDLSHVSVNVMHQAIDLSEAPVIFSHSSCRALCDTPRNVPDEILHKLKPNGGVVMVNFFSGFIHPEGAAITANCFQRERRFKAEHPDEQEFERALRQWKEAHPIPHGNVGTLVDHIDHIVRVAGIDHVGLGADYDGAGTMPDQLEDVSGYPHITQELLERGYSERDIHKILGGNLLRALRQAEQVSGKSGG